MRFITLSVNAARVDRLRRFLPDIEVFAGTEGCDRSNYRTVCIPDSYYRFEQWAVAEGIGLETVVMQDDVWIPHGGGFEDMHYSYPSNLIIYGRTEPDGTVVPKAFSATPAVHLLLADVWTGEGRIGPAWMPLVEEYGLVLDVTQDMGGPSSV
jgi:hypothetical protein